MIVKFVDPYNGEQLQTDSDGNLYSMKGDKINYYKNYNGCYDFVHDYDEIQKERDHYEKEYDNNEPNCLTEDDLKKYWYDMINPWHLTLLKSLGDLKNKTILLLGSGDKTEGIYFAMAGGNIIFTDLSLNAVRRVKKQVEISRSNGLNVADIEFHAVDAFHLPFLDGTFDVIYGSAFVHHLDNIEKFFDEVYRCLKMNGICRFGDQAYSPIWEFMKRGPLLPLKKYSYWRSPRSPGDLRADRRGGFTEEGCKLIMESHNFRDMCFIREWFLLKIVFRHYGKMFNWNPRAMSRARKLFLFCKRIDNFLKGSKFMKKNALCLTWGYMK